MSYLSGMACAKPYLLVTVEKAIDKDDDLTTRLSFQCRNLDDASRSIAIEMHYAGVVNMTDDGKDVVSNKSSSLVGINLKAASKTNDIYIAAVVDGEIKLIPKINELLAALCKNVGLELSANGLYLQSIENEILTVKYDPYGSGPTFEQQPLILRFEFRRSTSFELMKP